MAEGIRMGSWKWHELYEEGTTEDLVQGVRRYNPNFVVFQETHQEQMKWRRWRIKYSSPVDVRVEVFDFQLRKKCRNLSNVLKRSQTVIVKQTSEV